MTLVADNTKATFKMTIAKDNVIMYSGPSFRYRPLRTLEAGTELTASAAQFDGPDGSFYEVYYKYKKSGRKVVGFISITAPIAIEKGALSENLNEYVKLELAQSAAWLSFSVLTYDHYLWAFSYVKYPAPGIYLKALGGQLVNLATANTVVGGEIGLDQLIYNRYSIYSAFAGAVLFAAQENSLFPASQGATPFVYTSFGLRYNIDRYAALSGGFLLATLFNQNNASLVSGAGFGLEVGL